MAYQSKYYNTGGGELFFTPIVDGVLGTEVPFGQTENVNFSFETETITHDNTETETVFEDMNILKKVTGKLSIETIEVSPEMVQRAFLGNLNKVSIVASTGNTASVTITTLDTNYDIGSDYITNVVVKDSLDSTTYTEGVDYSVDYTLGTIKALSNGAISAGDSINITYDVLARDSYTIEAFMNSKIEGKLVFKAKSANGLNYVYTFHKVSLLASGDYALKSSDGFLKISFEGTLLASELVTDPTQSKLFKVEAVEVS